MTKFIVEVKTKSVRTKLAKIGKVGKPQTLETIIILETDRTMEEVQAIPGVISVEKESLDTPFDVEIQQRPDSWFLPSASNTFPDYHYDRTGEGVAIYFMDSGVRFDHEEFAGRDTLTVFTHDGLEHGGNVAGPDHGTMVASCGAGNQHGIAKGANIYSLRYNWTTSEGIKALDTLIAHHRTHDMPSVLSMSFGSYSNIYNAAFRAVAAEGIVMVGAAGNFDEERPFYPAARDDVISVAAVDRNLRPSVWGGPTPGSNYGPTVDIWAGGTSGVSASRNSSTATQTASGTSAACPLVAGALALQMEGRTRPASFADVLVEKQELIRRSFKGVVEYTDPKYNTTPNRYIYSLVETDVPPRDDTTPPGDDTTPPGDDITPEPDPRPRKDPPKERGGRNGPLILGAALVILFILGSMFL
jgi:subtilisin family serine protease